MADEAALRALLETNRNGVLVTLKADGRPQLSNILYAAADGVARISITESRAKARNLRRNPRASLYVTRDDFYAYAVAEGDAELTPPAAAPDDATVEELVDLYRTLRGEDHPDWDDYRRTMVEDKRLVVKLPLTRVYGMA